MGFVEATKSGFRNYVNFKDRASRSEFWWFVLAIWLGQFVFAALDSVLFGSGSTEVNSGGGIGFSYQAGILGTIWSLAVLIPSISNAVRRLHDTDRSGWWLLIVFIPFIGWIALLYFYVSKGTEGPNRFGGARKFDAEKVFGA